MKRCILRIVGRTLLVGPLVLLLGLGGWSLWQERQVRQREATELWLQNTFIPEIVWNDQTLAQCIQSLDERLRATPGHPRGLRIAFATPEETARRWRRQVLPIPKPVSIPGLADVPPAAQPPPPEKITQHYGHPSWAFAIHHTSSMSGAGVQIEARRILIHRTHGERGTLEPPVAKTVRWDPAVFQQHRNRKTKSGQELGEPGRDMRPFLAAHGLVFYEGCSAEFDPKTGVLYLRATKSNCDRIDGTLPFGRRHAWWEEAHMQWNRRLDDFQQWLRPPTATPPPGSPSTIPGL